MKYLLSLSIVLIFVSACTGGDTNYVIAGNTLTIAGSSFALALPSKADSDQLAKVIADDLVLITKHIGGCRLDPLPPQLWRQHKFGAKSITGNRRIAMLSSEKRFPEELRDGIGTVGDYEGRAVLVVSPAVAEAYSGAMHWTETNAQIVSELRVFVSDVNRPVPIKTQEWLEARLVLYPPQPDRFKVQLIQNELRGMRRKELRMPSLLEIGSLTRLAGLSQTPRLLDEPLVRDLLAKVEVAAMTHWLAKDDTEDNFVGPPVLLVRVKGQWMFLIGISGV